MTKKQIKKEAVRGELAYSIAEAISPDWKTTKRIARAMLLFDTLTLRWSAKRIGIGTK